MVSDPAALSLKPTELQPRNVIDLSSRGAPGTAGPSAPAGRPARERCPWCSDTGSIERVRVCKHRRGGICEPGCTDGWIYVRDPCDHGKGE